jgi:hypothetical protein
MRRPWAHQRRYGEAEPGWVAIGLPRHEVLNEQCDRHRLRSPSLKSEESSLSNYIPWYGKKRATLARREKELLRILKRGGEREVIRAAEEVRASRIRALKSERAQIPPRDGPGTARMNIIDEKINLEHLKPIDAIVAEYREKPLLIEQSRIGQSVASTADGRALPTDDRKK